MDRSKRFQREIKAADQAMKAQLLGAWKEALLERAATALKATNDPKLLSLFDTNLALVEEFIGTPRASDRE